MKIIFRNRNSCNILGRSYKSTNQKILFMRQFSDNQKISFANARAHLSTDKENGKGREREERETKGDLVGLKEINFKKTPQRN